mgnify:CR=1 FL=1
MNWNVREPQRRLEPSSARAPEGRSRWALAVGMKTNSSILIAVFQMVVTVHAQTNWNQIIAEPSVGDPYPAFSIRNLSGIGAVINKKDGRCYITQIFDGSGAETAGLKVDDTIAHVDSIDVSSLKLPEIAALLRGDPDTKVQVTVFRAGEPSPMTFTVLRHAVELR